MDGVRVGTRLPGEVHKYRAGCLPRVLTKGYESILWMDIRPALQAAGYEDLLCRQPDSCGSPWRTQVRDHGFDRVLSLSAAAEREIITVCATSARITTLSSKRTQKSTRTRPTCPWRKHNHCRPERFRFGEVLFVAQSAHLRRLHPTSRRPPLVWS